MADDKRSIEVTTVRDTDPVFIPIREVVPGRGEIIPGVIEQELKIHADPAPDPMPDVITLNGRRYLAESE